MSISFYRQPIVTSVYSQLCYVHSRVGVRILEQIQCIGQKLQRFKVKMFKWLFLHFLKAFYQPEHIGFAIVEADSPKFAVFDSKSTLTILSVNGRCIWKVSNGIRPFPKIPLYSLFSSKILQKHCFQFLLGLAIANA